MLRPGEQRKRLNAFSAVSLAAMASRSPEQQEQQGAQHAHHCPLPKAGRLLCPSSKNRNLLVCGRKVQAKLRSGHARARTLPRVVRETIPGNNSEPKVAMQGFSKQGGLFVFVCEISAKILTRGSGGSKIPRGRQTEITHRRLPPPKTTHNKQTQPCSDFQI